MKRIWNRAKRIGALTLATVLLAGVLALPASAAADPTYLADWAAIYQRTDDPSEDARALYQHMIQKYPSSPDAYFHYVQYTYVQWWNGREAYQPDEVPQLISYLDTVIRLEAENPETLYRSVMMDRMVIGGAEWIQTVLYTGSCQNERKSGNVDAGPSGTDNGCGTARTGLLGTRGPEYRNKSGTNSGKRKAVLSGYWRFR